MSTKNIDYNDLVSTLNHSMNSKLFLSYYLIMKHRPVLDSEIVEFIDKFKYLISDKDKATRIVERSQDTDNYTGKKNKIKNRYYERIKGGFGINYNLLVEKIKRYNLGIDCSSFLVFDSFDGANYLETTEGKVDLVSFNSRLVSSDLLSKL
jgi:hypothetical protein